ncbi:hypothetical protein DKX38_025879 [Salix brachista]|uniref:Apple domain-containing protein n=1 Tax=Salix brachista TaxID=2182728 RepID=A0A5N5JVG1_9ROSI|nr:hypothetical protein DKX38_025879 [Salix brachista]
MDWSLGCKRNKELECHNGDRFIRFDELKLPDANNSWINKTMNLKECRAKCLQNCSCTAYTNLDITGGGSGCAIWFGDLMDIRQVSAGGQELYVRVRASEIDDREVPKAKTKMKIAVISTPTIFVVFGILVASYYLWKRKAKGAADVFIAMKGATLPESVQQLTYQHFF